MEKPAYARVSAIYPEKKQFGLTAILDTEKFPIEVIVKNTRDFKLGQKVHIKNNELKIISTKGIDEKEVYSFTLGECNFEFVPDYYYPNVAYVSRSGSSIAIAVQIRNIDDTILAFLPRKENERKGDKIELPTYLEVVSKTKKDGSVFYFFQPGKCNFILAPPLIERWSNDDFYYDSGREEYYEELGDSVCEYCGEYHCDCQRNIDRDYKDNW